LALSPVEGKARDARYFPISVWMPRQCGHMLIQLLHHLGDVQL
jgi:hypothetical protein